MDTLNDILVKVSAVVSQTTSVTDTSDEYTLWRSYVNMAQKEWSESYDWPSLYRVHNTRTSQATGNASIAMPADFRKMAAYPLIVEDGSTTYEYQEIDQSKKMAFENDRYCYISYGVGDTNLVVHPKTTNHNLSSGASIQVPYWKSPASLASPANIVECPNPDYLVQRVIGMVWEAREDERFLQAKAQADKILARLLEHEMTRGEGYRNKIETEDRNFRIGRD